MRGKVRRSEEHTLDILFALILFAVFTICAVLLVLLGARIYGRIGADTNKMDAPVILSYLTEKLRSCETAEQILAEEDQLGILEMIEGKEYVTWIYKEEGYLKETLCSREQEIVQNSGTKIAPIRQFSVQWTEEDFLEFCVEDDQGTRLSRGFSFAAVF